MRTRVHQPTWHIRRTPSPSSSTGSLDEPCAWSPSRRPDDGHGEWKTICCGSSGPPQARRDAPSGEPRRRGQAPERTGGSNVKVLVIPCFLPPCGVPHVVMVRDERTGESGYVSGGLKQSDRSAEDGAARELAEETRKALSLQGARAIERLEVVIDIKAGSPESLAGCGPLGSLPNGGRCVYKVFVADVGGDLVDAAGRWVGWDAVRARYLENVVLCGGPDPGFKETSDIGTQPLDTVEATKKFGDNRLWPLIRDNFLSDEVREAVHRVLGFSPDAGRVGDSS